MGSRQQDPALTTSTNTFLLERLKSSDNGTVWGLFVGRYRPVIFKYARRLGLAVEDAEDATQKTLITFSTAYQNGKYDRDKGRLRHWLFGIARNEIRNVARRRQDREVQIVDSADRTGFFESLEDPEQAERLWEDQWQQAVLRQCLEEVRGAFEKKTIRAFELFAWKGWSARRVADHLGISENAVFLAKHKILKSIRKLVPPMEDAF